jgi:transposase
MAGKHKTMSVIKQILRLYSQGHRFKEVERITSISRNTIRKYVRLSEISSHSLEELLSWEDEKLEAYFTTQTAPTPERKNKLEQLLPWFEEQLSKQHKRILTRWVLWGEYRQEHADGYSYAHFCRYLERYQKNKSCSLHIDHLPGDKTYIDFAGKKLSYVDKDTGEIKPAEVLVGVLGYSQLTYVEATESQKTEEFVGACVNMVHFFGGSSKAIVPDNLKSAVTTPCRYEPKINDVFNDFANHYQMAVFPARSLKPQDKALVERYVSIVYTRVYSKLRNQTFFSLQDLNAAIRKYVDEHNQMLFQKKDYSRQQLFEREEKHLLSPLPPDAFDIKHYKRVTVMKNCHIQLGEDHHYYSVPYRYIGERVKLIYNRREVSVYFKGERIAYHLRNYQKYKYTTIKDHLPSQHQFVVDWSPEKFISWAAGIDQVVKEYIQKVLESKNYPEQTYKSCVGILSIVRKAGRDQLIAACAKGHQLGVYNYTFIKKVIDNGYALHPKNDDQKQTSLPFHENVRGPEYYQ